ncbi:hypothetical protein KI387_017937, partial [Taxus chinensis]
GKDHTPSWKICPKGLQILHMVNSWLCLLRRGGSCEVDSMLEEGRRLRSLFSRQRQIPMLHKL